MSIWKYQLKRAAMGAAKTFALALPVWVLWNIAMPQAFGLPKIGYGQAMALYLLACVLFKSNGGMTDFTGGSNDTI